MSNTVTQHELNSVPNFDRHPQPLPRWRSADWLWVACIVIILTCGAVTRSAIRTDAAGYMLNITARAFPVAVRVAPAVVASEAGLIHWIIEQLRRFRDGRPYAPNDSRIARGWSDGD